MTLRFKISALIAAALFLAIVSFSFFSLNRFSTESLIYEQQRFEMLSVIVNEQLNSSYFNHLSDQVQEISRQKDKLRRLTLLFNRDWTTAGALPSSTADVMIKHHMEELHRLGITIYLFRPGQKPIGLLNGNAPSGDWSSAVVYGGQPLVDFLNPDELPVDGLFLLVSFGTHSEDETYISLVMPDETKQNLITSFISLKEMGDLVGANSNVVLQELMLKIPTLPLDMSTAVGLFDGEGMPLMTQGQVSAPSLETLELVRKTNHLEQFIGKRYSRSFIRIEYFKPFDWFIVLETPESSILAPVRQLASSLILLGLIITAIFLILGIAAAHFFIRPLKIISEKALVAANLDFSSSEAEEFFQDFPMVKRKDEVGLLAKSFIKMGQTIIQNVKEILEAARVQERMTGELSAARRIQLGILPSPEEASSDPTFQAAAFLRPAKEIGGDFYDFFSTPNGLRALVIGDVSDKGVPAALFMTIVCTLVRRTISSGLAPHEALKQINEQLNERNPNSMFVTLFIGIFNPSDGTITYANGGHCHPLVVGPKGQVRMLDEGSPDPMVGVWPDLEYHLHQANLEPDEFCLLYTDGVTEAQNEKRDLFSESRLMALAGQTKGVSDPEKIIKQVYKELLLFRGRAPQSDDITMLAFRAIAPEGPKSPPIVN